MTLRENLHALMVAIMKGDKEEAYRTREELKMSLKTIFGLDTYATLKAERFLKTLEEVMEVWGVELEKARRLRAALKVFLDDEDICMHVDEEGGTGEEEIFYKYYFKDPL